MIKTIAALTILLFTSLAAGQTVAEKNLKWIRDNLSRFNKDFTKHEVTLTVVDELENGATSTIVPAYKSDGNKTLVIDLRISKKGLEEPLVIYENFLRLSEINGPQSKSKTFSSTFNWAETVANARGGSLQARLKLLEMELEVARRLPEQIRASVLHDDAQKVIAMEEANKKIAVMELQVKTAEKSTKLELKKRKENWELRRKTFTQLEKDELKFDDLVMKNDRKGVRKLLETYLPWELMEPVEVNNWKIWLEAIENPSKTDTVITFRGLDSIPILKPKKGGTPGLLASVLVKNQGNYTRRLRSLTTMRDTFGVYSKEVMDTVPHLSTMMEKHSIRPLASPFLSVAGYDVAAKFGRNRLMAIQIDKRRIIPNLFGLMAEQESLIPLVVFPDEVVHYQDLKKNKENFILAVEAKLGRPLRDEEKWRITARKSFTTIAQEKYPELMDVAKDDCFTGVMSALNHLLK